MSGALPMTTASMSRQVIPASSRARRAASRHSPAMETSPLVEEYLVWPTPTTAHSWPLIGFHSSLARCARSRGPRLEDADQVLLQAGARRGVGHDPPRRALV